MDVSRFYAYCLQGDVPAAYEYLRSIKDKSKKLQALELKYHRRFFTEKPIFRIKSDDTWIRKVLLAYYQYFIAALTKQNRSEAEIQLAQSLAPCIPNNPSDMDLDQIEGQLEVLFKNKGYHFLGGLTGPFRGPYIWKTMEKKEFRVELPYLTEEITVYFLSDFLLQSWIHFSTFGEKRAGGWAKPEGLYFVNDRPKEKKINLDSTEFQVSYLKHEAQHLSDYTRFPNLKPKDLEYRAKLVELIYEPNSFRLLKKFFYEGKNDPRFPHPYSSYVLMGKLTQLAFSDEEIVEVEQWKTVQSSMIQNWALRLYDEHTKQLDKMGKEARGVI
ncbi:hypothetical protein ABES03_15455 [Neobacillus rhizosphaerae]|uniref:hypothetical protein n=1 Tax=Neobacillus rhizosphaerae TaxID=2880965 RepID=UPI003D2BE590